MGLKEEIQCWLFGAIQSEYVIKDIERDSFVPGTNSCSSYRSKKLFVEIMYKKFDTYVEWELYEGNGFQCIEIIEKSLVYINLRDTIRDIVGWINRRTGRIMSHGYV